MLFRMIRSQTDETRTLHAGVAYDASDNPKLAALAEVYIKSGFAEPVTLAELSAEKDAAEKLSPTSPAPAADTPATRAPAKGGKAG